MVDATKEASYVLANRDCECLCPCGCRDGEIHVDQTLFAPYAWLFTSLAMIGTALWRRSLYLILLVIVGGLLLGLWRGSVLQSQLVVYEKLYGSAVTMTGLVSEDADTGRRGELVLRLSNLEVGGHVIAGKSWVSIMTDAEI